MAQLNRSRLVGHETFGFAAGDQNLYRYVGNSPTNFTDPSGLESFKPDWNPYSPPPRAPASPTTYTHRLHHNPALANVSLTDSPHHSTTEAERASIFNAFNRGVTRLDAAIDLLANHRGCVEQIFGTMGGFRPQVANLDHYVKAFGDIRQALGDPSRTVSIDIDYFNDTGNDGMPRSRPAFAEPQDFMGIPNLLRIPDGFYITRNWFESVLNDPQRSTTLLFHELGRLYGGQMGGDFEGGPGDATAFDSFLMNLERLAPAIRECSRKSCGGAAAGGAAVFGPR